MEFETKQLSCLQPLKRQLQSAEETGEIRLADGMPEIGTVLGAWGQIIVRSKEWNADSMGLSCGVMAWVLYMPEDGEGVYSAQTWMPVQLRWDLPPAERDGIMLASCAIRQLDARSTSSRKLMVRTVVDGMAEAWLPKQMQIPVPGDCPEDVQLLTETYPMLLPKEAGEKAFNIEETITLPGSVPKLEKLMYYRLQPELIDQKVMAGKAVFRGTCLLHLVYRTGEGGLFSWETEIPFSQYMDLDGNFEKDARITVHPCVTSLEAETNPDGSLQIKAGLLAQFLLCQQEMIPVAKDTYSVDRTVTPVYEDLYLPGILDSSTQTIHGELSVPEEITQIADVAFYPAYGHWEHIDGVARLRLPGFFRLLCYDGEHRLCSRTFSWEGQWSAGADPEDRMSAWIAPTGKAQAAASMAGVDLRGDLMIDVTAYTGQNMPVMTGMELEQTQPKDPNRPSLILCRKGDRSLWDVAKETGSTVADIKRVNSLEGEPDDRAILLIPVR